MDGRNHFSPRQSLLPNFFTPISSLAIIILLVLPHVCLAQAMGKVAVDPPSPALPTTPATAAPKPPTLPPGESRMAAHIEPVRSDTTDRPVVTPPVAQATIPPAAPAPTTPITTTTPNIAEATTPPTATAPAPASETKTPGSAFEHRPIRAQALSEEPAAAQAPHAPAAPSTLPSGITSALQVAAALAVVVGLIFIGKAAARKFVPGARAGNGKGVIEILARYPLAKNQSLVLVRIGSQIVALNQGKDASHSVLVINDPLEVARLMGQIEGTNPKSIQAGFSKLLSNARMDLEDPANAPEADDAESRAMEPENLDSQLEEMAAAKRQLMELRQQVRSVRDHIPRM